MVAKQAKRTAVRQMDQAIPVAVGLGRATRHRAWMDALYWATEASMPAGPVVVFVARREQVALPGLPATCWDRNY